MAFNRRQFLKTTGGLLTLPAVGFPSYAASLPKVLILGDSISIGYTPHVRELMADVAEVVRPEENCQGTTHGMKNITRWLGDQRWDVIHFNFGLHDLKYVDRIAGKNSNDPDDPQQADVRTYSKNLREITKQLKSTGASLVFATTTPFPDKPDGPLRRAKDVDLYNAAALKIMRKNRVAINDLHSFTLSRLQELQIPNNVHFTKHGSLILARQVVASIQAALKPRSG